MPIANPTHKDSFYSKYRHQILLHVGAKNWKGSPCDLQGICMSIHESTSCGRTKQVSFCHTYCSASLEYSTQPDSAKHHGLNPALSTNDNTIKPHISEFNHNKNHCLCKLLKWKELNKINGKASKANTLQTWEAGQRKPDHLSWMTY